MFEGDGVEAFLEEAVGRFGGAAKAVIDDEGVVEVELGVGLGVVVAEGFEAVEAGFGDVEEARAADGEGGGLFGGLFADEAVEVVGGAGFGGFEVGEDGQSFPGAVIDVVDEARLSGGEDVFGGAGFFRFEPGVGFDGGFAIEEGAGFEVQSAG